MCENTLPACANVAAGDRIRCVQTSDLVKFKDFNAAGIVVERPCSLKGSWGGKSIIFFSTVFMPTYAL